jgi:hypothetical protein
MIARLAALAFVPFFLFGCATSKYHWGNYEDSLYKHYKNPADQEKYAAALASVIEDGEQSGTVPPGIYAEYGYVFYSIGRNADSISYFEKEKKAWPESTLLMDKMIASAKKATADKASVGVGK